MNALTIRQPWAWLIVNGYKDIENRSWKTNHRGTFWIHAGKSFDHMGYVTVMHTHPDIPLPAPDEFPMGGLVGTVDIEDCVESSDSPWFTGKYGFVLKNPTKVPLIPYRGQMGFFNIPEENV